MFEGWVYQLVAGYLGNYIKDIHREQFRIGLWSGVALVENAELRLEAFDYLQLPFAIKQGFVGKLRLQIPWKTMFWEPIVIALEDVYICACPRDESEFDAEASEIRALAAKKAQLAAAEITKLSSQVPDEKVRQSLFSHLLAKFIANIQITVRNIHIRYVDDKGSGEGSFYFGVKLAGLTAVDARGTSGNAAKAKNALVRKSVEVSQLAVYWNSTQVPRQVNNTVGHYFSKWFTKKDEELNYILDPMDLSSKLTLNRSAGSEGSGAQYALTVSVDKLDLNLGSRQLYEMFLLWESLKVSQLRERYGRFRPQTCPSKERHWQRLWWQYAINAVSSDVQKRLRRSSWKYFGWRLTCRHRYVNLYKAKLEAYRNAQAPADGVLADLEQLERELDMDMILSFRSLAEDKCLPNSTDATVKAMDPLKKEALEDKLSEPSQPSQRGWLSLFSFGMLGGSGTMDAAAEFTGPFSDELMKDIYEVTNFHPTPLPNGDWAKGYSFLAMSLQLRQVIARMENSDTRSGLVEGTFNGISAGFRKLQNLASAAIAVKSFNIVDICTEGSCFPNVVTSKGFNSLYSSKHKSYAEAVYSAHSQSLFEIGISQRELNEAAFSVDIELSEDPCLKVAVVLKPLEITYSPLVISGLLTFFKLPVRREVDEVPKALTIPSQLRRTWTKLVLTVDIRNPVLLIPVSCSLDSEILTISLESLRFAYSEVHGLVHYPNVLLNGNATSLQESLKSRLPNLVVDIPSNVTALEHFEVALTSFQVGIVEGSTNLSTSACLNVVSPFDIQMNAVKYKDSFLNHIKIDGRSGEIKIVVSPEKVTALKDIFRTARGAFEPLQQGEVAPTTHSPSSLISAHYSVASLVLKIALPDDPSGVKTSIDLNLQDLMFAMDLQKEISFSIARFTMENTEIQKDCPDRFLIRGKNPLTMTYHRRTQDPLQLHVHLQDAEFRIFPRICSALVAFVSSENQTPSGGISSKNSPVSFTFELRNVSVSLHEPYGLLTTLLVPNARFLFSSADSAFENWEILGNATDLQLTGPDFATQMIEGIPFGSMQDGPLCSLDLRLLKQQGSATRQNFDLLVAMESVECILQSDFLALIIGFFTSPDWAGTSRTPVSEPEMNTSVVVFEYKIEARKSLLLVPIGGGGFAAIVIPEFRFAFIPSEMSDVSACYGFSGLRTQGHKRFYVTGKQLSLVNYGLDAEPDERRCCLPLINCLDGDVMVEVPLSNDGAIIHLRFSVVDLTLIAETFLRQINWVEELSNDLAVVGVGNKASHVIEVWEGMNNGKRFVLPPSGSEKQEPCLEFKCSIDTLRLSLERQADLLTVETVSTAEVRFVSSDCTIGLGLLEDLTVSLGGIGLVDGVHAERRLLDAELNRAPKFNEWQLQEAAGRTMVTLESEASGVALKIDAKMNIVVVLPRAEIWVHSPSWGKFFSWVLVSFPMLSSTPDESELVAESGAQPRLVFGVNIPKVTVFLPGVEQQRGEMKTVCFTSGLQIEEFDFDFSDYKCSFSARLFDLKGEAREGTSPGHHFLSAGDILMNGNIELSSRILVSVFLTVASIDSWCSCPVLQFLGAFRMEPSGSNDGSSGMEVAINVKTVVQTASLLVTDGRWNYNCPLLELIAGDSIGELSWSGEDLQVTMASIMELSYHNIQKAVWEPFLEPWNVSVGLSRKPGPTIGTHTTKLDIKSSSNLNVNITEGLVKAAKRAMEMITWKEELELGPHCNGTTFSKYAPYWFQNDTGTAVLFALILPDWSDDRIPEASRWCKVLPGCSAPIFIDETEGSFQGRKARWNTPERKKFGLISHRRLRVRVEGTARPSLPMSIDLVGSRAFEVVFSKLEDGNTSRYRELEQRKSAFSTHVLFEVSLQHHSKLIRLQSTVSLANTTSVILEVRFEIPFGIAPKIMEPILPGQVIPLPVHLAETGRIRIRPQGEIFLWSEALPLSKLISPEYRLSAQRPVVCYSSRLSDGPFRCCINVEEQTVSESAAEITSGSQRSTGWKKWNIVFRAPFVVKNCLPQNLDVEIEGGAGLNVRTFVPRGDSVFVYEVDVVNDLNVRIITPNFLPSSIKFGGVNSRDKPETTETLVFSSESSSGRPLWTRADKIVDFASGRREICISAPYWLYNYSGLDLAYIDGDADHLDSEQVLRDAYNQNKAISTTARNSQGLHSLFKSGENMEDSFRKRPGRIPSHLPSSRVLTLVKPVTSPSLSNLDVIPQDASPPSADLYSPAPGSDVSEHKMRVRVFHSTDSAPVSWTQPFFLDPPGGTSPIIIPQPDTKGAYVLSVASMPAMGACSGWSKTVTFRPRFVLANASQQDICFKQQGTDVIHLLPVGQNIHVHWTDTTRPLQLSVRYNQHGWEWSGGFVLDRLGDTQVKVHNHLSGTKEILRVEVSNPDAEGKERLGTFFAIVTNDETGFMPFRIDNFSTRRLRFYQKRCEKTENIVQPYSSCDYAWDEPCLPPQLVIEVPGEGSLGAYELESVKSYPPVQLHASGEKGDRRLVVSVHAEGARRVLSVVDLAMHAEKDSRKFQMGRKLTDSSQSVLEELSVNLPCVGISLVDSTPQELVYGSATGVKFRLLQSDREQDMELQISHLQLDNQLRHATYPVLLSTSSGSETAESKPALSVAVSKWKHPTGSVDCYHCIYLSIAPVCLELEERNLTRLAGFFGSLMTGGSNMGTEKSMNFKLQRSNGDLSPTSLRFVQMAEAEEVYRSWPAPAAVEPLKFPTKRLITSAKQKRKAYIEDFCIENLELTISFSSNPWLPKEARGMAAESVLWVTGSLLQRRLIALADVEGAPIRLRQLRLAHPMANWNAILSIIQRHYTRQLLHEVYKVLGSADVFGNPMGFMRSLGAGVWDFVSAPARSIRQNPVYVVQGVRLGTKSLFRNTIFAFSNAATQMSKAARKGVAALALDQDYISEHEHQDSSVVNEFLEGLTGLLQSSVRGAERHGIPGVFSGMAVGVLRAVARPAASVLDVAGKTAQSIRNSSRPAQLKIARVRLPRHLDPGSPLLPYSWQEALAMAVLLEADNGRLKDEIYLTCQQLSEPGVFVLLTKRLLLQVKATGREDLEVEWSIVCKKKVEDILYVDRDGERLDVLFCAPKPAASPDTHPPQRTSPFNSIALSLCCSEDADELFKTLLQARRVNL